MAHFCLNHYFILTFCRICERKKFLWIFHIPFSPLTEAYQAIVTVLRKCWKYFEEFCVLEDNQLFTTDLAEWVEYTLSIGVYWTMCTVCLFWSVRAWGVEKACASGMYHALCQMVQVSGKTAWWMMSCAEIWSPQWTGIYTLFCRNPVLYPAQVRRQLTGCAHTRPSKPFPSMFDSRSLDYLTCVSPPYVAQAWYNPLVMAQLEEVYFGNQYICKMEHAIG